MGNPADKILTIRQIGFGRNKTFRLVLLLLLLLLLPRLLFVHVHVLAGCLFFCICELFLSQTLWINHQPVKPFLLFFFLISVAATNHQCCCHSFTLTLFTRPPSHIESFSLTFFQNIESRLRRETNKICQQQQQQQHYTIERPHSVRLCFGHSVTCWLLLPKKDERRGGRKEAWEDKSVIYRPKTVTGKDLFRLGYI